MRLDSMSDCEVDDNPVAALAFCPKGSYVRYDFVAVSKRVDNSLDFLHDCCMIKVPSDVRFVHQPIF